MDKKANKFCMYIYIYLPKIYEFNAIHHMNPLELHSLDRRAFASSIRPASAMFRRRVPCESTCSEKGLVQCGGVKML